MKTKERVDNMGGKIEKELMERMLNVNRVFIGNVQTEEDMRKAISVASNERAPQNGQK